MNTKTEANWVAVNADVLSGDSRKAWEMIEAGKAKLKATLVSQARTSGKLPKGKTLAIAYKGWGFSMAIVDERGNNAKASGKDLFASL